MLLAYLKSRAMGAAVLALFCGVFALVFYLCGLPLNAVAYAGLICAALGAALLAVDYLHFHQRVRLLGRLLSCPENAADALPEPRGEVERGYQALLRAVRAGQLAGDAQRREKAAAMSDYYTLWAHQIKTPIAAMRLVLQDMDGDDAGELRGELGRIEQYVEMALWYIRLDGEDTDHLIRRCDLDALLRRELRAASTRFIRGRIALEFEETHFSPLTDEKWLGFAVGQILSNALKYTPPGGWIRVDMPEAGVLEISDSGVGIVPEDLPRVTESGFTGENGRADTKATGLGLYLCRRILDRLGHGLEITSTRGEGTQVRIDLRSARMVVE